MTHKIKQSDLPRLWECSCGGILEARYVVESHARLANLEEIAKLSTELANRTRTHLDDDTTSGKLAVEILELCKEVGIE